MTTKKDEQKKLSDAERIDAILALLAKNGISIPKGLR